MNRLLAGFALACALPIAAHADLLDRGNGLMYDTATDLTWSTDFDVFQFVSPVLYYEAIRRNAVFSTIEYLNTIEYKGFDVWRLPNAFADTSSCAPGSTPYSATECASPPVIGSELQTLAETEGALARFTHLRPYGYSYYINYSYVPKGSGRTEWAMYQLATLTPGYGDVENRTTGWFLPVAQGDIAAPVPEPSSIAMFGAGIALLALVRRRKRYHP